MLIQNQSLEDSSLFVSINNPVTGTTTNTQHFQDHWGSLHDFLEVSDNKSLLKQSIINEEIKQSKAINDHFYQLSTESTLPYGDKLRKRYGSHKIYFQPQTTNSSISPRYYETIKDKFSNSEQQYVFKPERKYIIKREIDRASKLKMKKLSLPVNLSLLKSNQEVDSQPNITLSQVTSPQNGYRLNQSFKMPSLKHTLKSVEARVSSFRDPNSLTSKPIKRFEDVDVIDDLPLFNSNAGQRKKLNNLYKIKIRVEEQINSNSNEAQKKYQSAVGVGNENGPSSKDNYLRFNTQIKNSLQGMGVRLIHNKMDLEICKDSESHKQEALQEATVVNVHVLQKDNPLIPLEHNRIIEASIPKHTMKQLLGLTDQQFLVFKKAEQWMRKRQIADSKFHEKEKNVEFAKELFKIWDHDQSGILVLEELALPLVALGLSTDQKFVQKILQALDSKKGNNENLQFTLKDFVKIFKTDKVGERITKIVKQAYYEKRLKQQKDQSQHRHKPSLHLQSLTTVSSPAKTNRELLSVKNSYLLHESPDARQQSRQYEMGQSKEDLQIEEQFQEPTIAEMMEIISEWWQTIDSNNKLEAPMTRVADLLVSKKIAPDVDTASKIVYKASSKRDSIVTFEDFNKVFCKCIFKDSLISMTDTIEALATNSRDMPLTLKLGNYQRSMMMDGLSQTEDQAQKGVDIMSALYRIMKETDNRYKNLKYKEFVNDPLGEIARLKALELSKMKKVDDYTQGIRFGDLRSVEKQTDLDQQIVHTCNVESLFDQEKQQLIQQRLANEQEKMLSIHINPKIGILNSRGGHKTTKKSHQGTKYSGFPKNNAHSVRSSIERTTIHRGQEVTNKHSYIELQSVTARKNRQTTGPLVSFDDFMEDKLTQEHVKTKQQRERENEVIERTKNSSMIAMYSRHLEEKNQVRSEAVKFPNIYREKDTGHRKEEESDLLEHFQKLLGTRGTIENVI